MNQQNFGKRSVLASGILALVVGAAPQTGWAQTSSMVVTETGNVGLGIDAPVRQLHMRGPNAVLRMDRDSDSAAFTFIRTAPGDFDTVWKGYNFALRASGPNNGSFVITDLGQRVVGPGNVRLSIDNAGVVTVGSLVQTSSARYKSDVETLSGTEEALDQLRGVKFTRIDTGREDIGVVAEEVAEVYPQLVHRDLASGQVEAVNYSAMVAVLIEGYKSQKRKISEQDRELSALRKQVRAIQEAMAASK